MALSTQPWYRHLSGMYRPLDFAPRAKTPAPFKAAPMRRLDDGQAPVAPPPTPYLSDDNDFTAPDTGEYGQMMAQQGYDAAPTPVDVIPPVAPDAEAPINFDTPPPTSDYLGGDTDGPPPAPKASSQGISPQYSSDLTAYKEAVRQAPQMTTPKWWQRALGAAAGFGAGYSNAASRTKHPIDVGEMEQNILHPGYQSKLADWQSRVAPLKAAADIEAQRQRLSEEAAQSGARVGLETNQATEALSRAKHYGEMSQDTLDARKYATTQKAEQDFLKGREQDARYIDAGAPVPAGYDSIPSSTVPGKVIIAPGARALTQDLAPYAPGYSVGELIPFGVLLKAQQAANAERVKATAAAKAPGSEGDLQGALSKIWNEPGPGGKPLIGPDTLTSMDKTLGAIRSSKVLTDDEKGRAIGFLGSKTTPESSTTAGILRMMALSQTRPVQMLDSKNGNAPVTINMDDLNRANTQEPGRFISAGAGVPALNKEALLSDIRGGTQQVRDSLTKMPDFNMADKAKIALALRSRDPHGAVGALISGGALASMNPDQQDYLVNVTNLVENAMAMRSVLGAGQGSDDLRDAIKAVIPGPATPNKAYALKQLDVFEKTLGRLERGVPNVPLRGNAPGAPAVNPQVKAYADQYFGGDATKAQAAIDAQRGGRK